MSVLPQKILSSPLEFLLLSAQTFVCSRIKATGSAKAIYFCAKRLGILA